MQHDFRTAFHLATAHGVVSAVHIPDAPDAVPAEALGLLHPAEAEHALTLRGYRQVHFVGGRIALREARRQLGAPLGPALPDERGTPTLPEGFTGSISHKRTLALALVARNVEGTVGVDLEDREPARLRIADRVLRPSELAALDEIPEERRRWQALLLRFSLKESIYKAIDPWVRRYVGFHEAEVRPDLQGGASVELHLDGGEGPFEVHASYRWLPGRLVTSVRIRPLVDPLPPPV